MRIILLFAMVAMATARLAPLLTHTDSITGSYIIKLKDGSNVEASIAALGDIKVDYKYNKVFRGFSARLTERMVELLRNSDAVEYIEENGLAYASEVASWGLDRIDQISLPLDDQYNQLHGNGASASVYVLDTGINVDHEDFGSRSFVAFDALGGTGIDCNGHGSHCAGTIAGTDYGVAKGVDVYGVRVLGCTGSGSWAGIIAGCDWVAANASFPAVASMSLGGGASLIVDQAVQGMIDAGITVAVAAGNDDRDACSFSPARVFDAITTGATNDADTRAYFSNYGQCVDIFAPGVSITSAWMGNPDSSRTISGTSMACPHVAGAAAIFVANDPTLSPIEVKEELQMKAIADAVLDPEFNSPNLLLYMGVGDGGGFVPSPPPPPPPCGGYFNESTGIMYSPNYPSNYEDDSFCEYDIVGRQGSEIVFISFLDFRLELSTNNCDFDSLSAYDGSSSSDPLIGKWCGTSPPGNFTGTGNTMHLVFTSDYSVNFRGFAIAYNLVEKGECGDEFSSDIGLFSSPNYPENYGNHADCSVVIAVEEGKTITLSFNDFEVEGHVSCGYDAVEVYDGMDETSERIANLCGSEIPDPVTSSGNAMFVRFTSDSSMNQRGFDAMYTTQ